MRLKIWLWYLYSVRKRDSGGILKWDMTILRWFLFPIDTFKLSFCDFYDYGRDIYKLHGEEYSGCFFRTMHDVKELPIHCTIFRKNGIVHIQENDYNAEYNPRFRIRKVGPLGKIKKCYLWLTGRPYRYLKGHWSDELVEMNNLHSEELEKQMIDILNKELEEEYPDRTFPKLLIKKLKDEENDLSKNHRK